MRFGSVCSGIEAASVAWHVYGWEAAWFAEVDRAASDVLAYRFPDVPNHGDMTLLAAMVRRREIPAPDVLVGGTPCQPFSIAGLRGGLADARGQLTLAFVDLANAIDEVRAADGLEPVIIVWENVPGVLTHSDNPLGCFLAGLAGDDDPVEPGPRPEPARSSAYWTWDKKAGVHRAKWSNSGAVTGPQRTAAWVVKDAQYFGLAQRRRRVFVVASAREGFDPANVLLEFDGVRRDSAPSREAGEGFTHPVAPCLTGSGRGVERTGDTRGQDADDGVLRLRQPADVAATLDASYGRLQGCSGQDANHGHSHLVAVAYGGNNTSGPIDVATARNAYSGPHGRLDFESETFVLEPIHIVHGTQDPCVSETTAFALGRNNGGENVVAFTNKDYGGVATVDMSPTLRSMGHANSHANGGGQVGVAYAVSLCGREGGGTAELGDDLAGCLRASTGGGDKPHVLTVFPFDTTQITSPSNYSSPREGDTGHPLAAGAHPPAVCITGSVMHTLKAEGFDASEDGTGRGQPIVPAVAFAQNTRSEVRLQGGDGQIAGALSADSGMNQTTFLATEMAVRHLMPVECERLQGFPDNWTLVPTGPKGKPAADGPRYKQLGNSMATNVMRWIGGRIVAELARQQTLIGHNGGPALGDDFDSLLSSDDFEALL